MRFDPGRNSGTYAPECQRPGLPTVSEKSSVKSAKNWCGGEVALAAASGARIFAMTRGEANRELARSLPAAFVGKKDDRPPELLDAAIVFAPAGELVPVALTATRPGGTVVLAGIHMSQIPSLSYTDTLFNERDLRTVTANTRSDGMEFLRLAQVLDIRPNVTTYPFEQADEALADLRAGDVSGSLVIVMD